jgi:thioredoxin 1
MLSSAGAAASGLDERLEGLQQKGVPAMLEVGSESCPPCRMMKPVLKKLSEEYQGRLEIIYVDMAEDREFAVSRGVRTLPTQIFLDGDGREFKRHFGYFSYDGIKDVLKKIGL